MDFWKSISGQVCVELVSARLERTLLLLNAEGITLYRFQKKDPLTGIFWISRRDWKQVQHLCDCMEGKARILSRRGMYWTVVRLRRRPVILSGLAAALILSVFLPGRILFVQVEGNVQIPEKRILEAAESSGIHFGASREEVRSEKVKNALLWQIPQLQWAGVNTSGCVATISVRERDTKAEAAHSGDVSGLAASMDGYVIRATATRGNLMVQPGQTVTEGQLLISGFTDCGIAVRAERAEGEVFAQTNRKITVLTPSTWHSQRESGSVRKRISILLGKKRIFLWKDSGIYEGSCGRMYKEYYITLPGDFRLPVAVCVDTFREYETEVFCLTQEEAADFLTEATDDYLTDRMAGGVIRHRQARLFTEEDCVGLTAEYVCEELISRVRIQQIGEANGENSGTDR